MAYKGNYKTLLRPQEDGEDEPAYVSSRKAQRNNRPENYAPGSPQMRHWKSYLAPELSRQNNGDYSNDYQQLHDSNLTGGRLRGGPQLEGARSYGYLQQANRLDRSDDDRYRNPKRDDYSRRKDEIMNRIKALQDKTSTRQRNQYRSQSQTNLNRGNFNEEQIEARLSTLEERVQQLESQFESRIEKIIQNLESRLNSR